MQNLSGSVVVLLSLIPARRCVVERGQAERSEAEGEATASLARDADNLCTHPVQSELSGSGRRPPSPSPFPQQSQGKG